MQNIVFNSKNEDLIKRLQSGWVNPNFKLLINDSSNISSITFLISEEKHISKRLLLKPEYDIIIYYGDWPNELGYNIPEHYSINKKKNIDIKFFDKIRKKIILEDAMAIREGSTILNLRSQLNKRVVHLIETLLQLKTMYGIYGRDPIKTYTKKYKAISYDQLTECVKNDIINEVDADNIDPAIDWSDSAEYNYNKINKLNQNELPAKTNFGVLDIYIWGCGKTLVQSNGPDGEIVKLDRNGIDVKCGCGNTIKLTQISLTSPISDRINPRFREGTCLGRTY